MSKAGSRLISAANEAREIAKGVREPARRFIPADIDVKAIRRTTGLTQEDFAATYGFTVTQIRDWEQHRARPLGGVRAYLMLIQKFPNDVAGLVRETRDGDNGDDEAA